MKKTCTGRLESATVQVGAFQAGGWVRWVSASPRSTHIAALARHPQFAMQHAAPLGAADGNVAVFNQGPMSGRLHKTK